MIRTNTYFGTFSGTDIDFYINGTQFENCQAISYTIHREKTAEYKFGEEDPRSFKTEKRGIAGTLVCGISEEHPLISQLDKYGVKYVDELPPFDITLIFNIKDHKTQKTISSSKMEILGVEIINEGGGNNIDDLVTQVAFTWVGKEITALRKIK